MKITSIIIKLEPNQQEIDQQGKKITFLQRDGNKMWTAYDDESPEIRGLYAFEVRLAQMIQEQIIQKFNV